MEETINVSLDSTDLIRLADPFARLMNTMQREGGESIEDVVVAGLYALGCALAQMHAIVDVNSPVHETLGSLAYGYTAARSQLGSAQTRLM